MSTNNVLDSVAATLAELACAGDVLQHFNEVRELLLSDPFEAGDVDGNLVNEALANIAATKKNDIQKPGREESTLKNFAHAFQAIGIFKRALQRHPVPEFMELERKLFRAAFSPTPRGAHVYPVYLAHDKFLETERPIVHFKNSCGSGKTRCMPFFFALRALHENMEHPFVIITKSASSEIKERMEKFNDSLGTSVELVTKVKDFSEKLSGNPTKPVIGLFTPHSVIKFLKRAQELNVPFVSRTRFCLDNINERSVETDVMVALLSSELKNGTFPLHVLMTSPTQDSRVQSVFEDAKPFVLTCPHPFPVQTIGESSECYADLGRDMVNSTINIIERMADESLELGHILVFTASNKDMKQFTQDINRTVAEWKPKGREVSMLPWNPERTLDAFRKWVKGIAEENPNFLFVLPIMFPEYADQFLKELAEREIPDCPNVVKVIVATDLLDSSISIDGLAAVVDCGVCFAPEISQDGAKVLEQTPIFKDIQDKRRRKVGKVRDGIYVHFVVKSNPPSTWSPPAIEVDDISSNILSLRRIGLRLEDIANLPEPGVPRDTMEKYLKELRLIGALDGKNELTELGQRLASFEGVRPFAASAIIKASEKYEGESTRAIIVGTHAFLVMTTEHLYIDPTNPMFEKHFCKESDVFTLMSAILETVQQTSPLKDAVKAAGFHSVTSMALIDAVERLSAHIDKQAGEGAERWTAISEFYHKVDMFEFVEDILKNIEAARLSWISRRRATFSSVYNCPEKPKVVYSPETAEENPPKITVSQRPGWTGAVTPGRCFIMQLSKAKEGHLRGWIVHQDRSRPEVTHPISLEVSGALKLWQFAYPLVRAYLSDFVTEFVKGSSSQGIFVAKLPVLITQSAGKTTVTYIPKELTDEMRRKIEDGIRNIERLMPYVPRCLLVHYRTLGAIVGITSYGDGNVSSKVFLESHESIAYAIDKTTINYLLANIEELSSPEGNLLIAMTAENFFFSLDSEDTDEETMSPPWVGMDKMVFHRPSHMVILSQREIPDGTKLPWSWEITDPNDFPTDYHAFIANTLWRGHIHVHHNSDMIFGMEGRVVLKGELPSLPRGLQESDAPIGRFFDRYAMHYAIGRKLGSDIKPFEFFCPQASGKFSDLRASSEARGRLAKRYSEKDIDKYVAMIPAGDMEHWKRLKSERDAATRKQFFLQGKIKEKNDVCAELEKLYNLYAEAKQANNQMRIGELGQKIREMERRRNAFGGPNEEITSVNERIRQLTAKMNDIVKHVRSLGIPFSDDEIGDCLSVNWRDHSLLSALSGIRAKGGIVTVLAKFKDCGNVIETMRRSRLTVDRIPVMFIIITHRKTDCQCQKDFETAVRHVCARFGGLVAYISPYKPSDGGKDVLGSILVWLYTYEFILPFVSEMKAELSGSDNRTVLKIPHSLCPPSLLSKLNVKQAFLDWANNHGISLEWVKNRAMGSEDDVSRARKLLNSPDTCPVLPFKVHVIPGGMDLDAIQYVLRGHNKGLSGKNKWILLRMQKSLVTPVEVSDEDVKAFLEMASTQAGKPSSGDDLLFDYVECCYEDAECSRCQIPVYYEDGSVRFYTFCVHCCHSLLSFNVATFFNEEDDEPIMERVSEVVDPIQPLAALGDPSEGAWPAVPLGQFMWMLASETRTKAVAKTWFTVKVFQALRASQMFEACPYHSAILLPNPPDRDIIRCRHPGCAFYRCPDCMQWHQGKCTNSKLSLPPGYRKCPNCKRLTFKCAGDNHITCQCGKQFCYYCGYGPCNGGSEIYRHFSAEHEGCFNNPPDYRHYILGQAVSQQELDEFYGRYPHLRPET